MLIKAILVGLVLGYVKVNGFTDSSSWTSDCSLNINRTVFGRSGARCDYGKCFGINVYRFISNWSSSQPGLYFCGSHMYCILQLLTGGGKAVATAMAFANCIVRWIQFSLDVN